jgi:hypothetical protein
MNEKNDSEEPSSTLMSNASDLFSRKSYREKLAPAQRDFRAWHRPRKQVVRQIQWGSEISWLLDPRLSRFWGLAQSACGA